MNRWQKMLVGMMLVGVLVVPQMVGLAKEGKEGKKPQEGMRYEQGKRNALKDRKAPPPHLGSEKPEKKGHHHEGASLADAFLVLAVEKYAPSTMQAWNDALTKRTETKKALDAVMEQLKAAKIRPPKPEGKPDETEHVAKKEKMDALIEAVIAKDAEKVSALLQELLVSVQTANTTLSQRLEQVKKLLPASKT